MSLRHKILLAGGTGFIGEYLIRSLQQKYNNSIAVIHSSPLLKNNSLAGIEYHQIDLSQEQENELLKSAIYDVNTLVILTPPHEKIIQNLMTMATFTKNLRKILYVSTLLLYPDSPKKQDESCKIEPISSYEKNKFLEETLLKEFAESHNLNLCIARLANVYGDIKNNGIISKIFLSLLKDRELVINGGGSQKRDYIFVEDAAALLRFLTLSQPKTSLEIFNICTGEGYTINELLGPVEKITKQRINASYGPAVLEKQIVIGENQKILNASGYKLRYNLIRGLRKTYVNYLAKRTML